MPAAIVPCVEVPFASIFTGMIRQPSQPAATTRATPVPWPWSSCVSTELSKTLRPAISPGTDGSTPESTTATTIGVVAGAAPPASVRPIAVSTRSGRMFDKTSKRRGRWAN